MRSSLCRLLDWDTDFFGIRIARVAASRVAASEMAGIVDWCVGQRVECLYWLAVSDDAQTVRLAEDNHFRLVDVRMTYERRTTRSPRPPGIREFQPDDLAPLVQIASVSHFDSRFHYDHNFPPGSCERLYATWMEKSCSGYAQAVIVAECGSKPAGYVTCHWSEDEGHIGLLGVAEWARGRGIGKDLVMASLDVFECAGISTITVPTQARNVASQRLYGRCGFRVRSVELWYHRWFERKGGDS